MCGPPQKTFDIRREVTLDSSPCAGQLLLLSKGFCAQVTQRKHMSGSKGVCRLWSSSCMSCEDSEDPGPKWATVGSLLQSRMSKKPKCMHGHRQEAVKCMHGCRQEVVTYMHGSRQEEVK